MTNSDKIFKAVIEDENLIRYGGYNPDNYNDVFRALDDENLTIATVAKIVYYQSKKHSDKEVYKEVTNFLKNNL